MEAASILYGRSRPSRTEQVEALAIALDITTTLDNSSSGDTVTLTLVEMIRDAMRTSREPNDDGSNPSRLQIAGFFLFALFLLTTATHPLPSSPSITMADAGNACEWCEHVAVNSSALMTHQIQGHWDKLSALREAATTTEPSLPFVCEDPQW